MRHVYLVYIHNLNQEETLDKVFFKHGDAKKYLPKNKMEKMMYRIEEREVE